MKHKPLLTMTTFAVLAIGALSVAPRLARAMTPPDPAPEPVCMMQPTDPDDPMILPDPGATQEEPR